MLGPVPIRAYALCIIAGIVVAVLWGEKRFVARGGEPGVVTDVAVFAVPFGLVGGRLYHVATDWKTYFGPEGNPVDALKIWHGGLGIWGAVALGAVGAWIGCRRRGVPLPFFADAVAPGIVTAQAIGRLGNWFNQELYGGPTTLPWGLEIYRRVDPATGITDPLGRRRDRPHPDRDRAAHVPLRAAVEPARRRPRRVGGPAVPARARAGLRRLRRGLHARPVLHRADAHRPGDAGVRRHPDQRAGRGRRLRRRDRLPADGAQAPRGAAVPAAHAARRRSGAAACARREADDAPDGAAAPRRPGRAAAPRAGGRGEAAERADRTP